MKNRVEWLANLSVACACAIMAVTLARGYPWTSAPIPAKAPTPSKNSQPSIPADEDTANQFPADLPGMDLPMVDAARTRSHDVAAIIGASAITTEQIEAALRNRMIAIRSQEYELKRGVLEQSIDRALVQKAAAARQLSVKELLEREVGPVPAPPPSEVDTAYGKDRERYSGLPEAEAKRVVALNLRSAALKQRLQKYLTTLRDAAGGVRIFMDPPRFHLDEGLYPSRGPKDAVVTIVEFTDFECPYCASSRATLRELDERYAGKLRVVFRHFPLDIHKNATRASEAAECAGEQGQFWRMHDVLFENRRLDTASLQDDAARIGLTAEPFRQCLESGRFKTAWQRDRTAGLSYGVANTPTFFVNGRIIVGAVPVESFVRVIDEELERATERPATAIHAKQVTNGD